MDIAKEIRRGAEGSEKRRVDRERGEIKREREKGEAGRIRRKGEKRE